MYIIRTKEFDKTFNKLDNSIKILIEKQIKILKDTKGQGKQIYKFLYERKVEGYRLFYFKFEDEIIILILATISNKKIQQEIIDNLKYDLPRIEKFVDDFKKSQL